MRATHELSVQPIRIIIVSFVIVRIERLERKDTRKVSARSTGESRRLTHIEALVAVRLALEIELDGRTSTCDPTRVARRSAIEIVLIPSRVLLERFGVVYRPHGRAHLAKGRERR